MARITHVKSAQQRYEQVPMLGPDGKQLRSPVMSKLTGEQKTTKHGRSVFMELTKADKTKPLPPLECEYCDKPIEVGTPYNHVTPFNGAKRTRHATCPTWRASELSSSKMATVMAAQESFGEQIGSLETYEDIESALNDVAEAAREVGQEYTESADNMEDGFGHETEMSMELRDRGDQLESWADEVEQAIGSEDTEPTIDHTMWVIVDPSGKAPTEQYETEEDARSALDEYLLTMDDGDNRVLTLEEVDALEANEEETQEWLDNLQSVASDVVDNCPV